jgi:hypothetical protein
MTPTNRKPIIPPSASTTLFEKALALLASWIVVCCVSADLINKTSTVLNWLGLLIALVYIVIVVRVIWRFIVAQSHTQNPKNPPKPRK